MQDDKEQLPGESDVPYRRRGRPAGKNRVPLSQEERRARNAHYERERRNETAEVMTQLIEAVNCDPNISNAYLLATVITRIQRASIEQSTENIEELERINANLEAQIAALERQLGLNDEIFEQLATENDNRVALTCQGIVDSSASTFCNHDDQNFKQQVKKRKRLDRLSSGHIQEQQEKRTKTQANAWPVDSAIDSCRYPVSPPTLCLHNSAQCLLQNEQLQLPVVMNQETDHHLSQAHIEQPTEIYNQIYSAGSQSSVESTSECHIETLSTELIPTIDYLSRSLFVIPAIISPSHQNKSEVRPEYQAQLNSTDIYTEGPSCYEAFSVLRRTLKKSVPSVVI